MRRFGLFGLLLIVVLVLLVGGVGYSLGVAAGPPQVVAPGTVVYPAGYGHWSFGFGFFGIVFFILIVGLIFSALRPRRWGGGPGWRGGMGPGGWHGMGPGGWGANVDPNDPRMRDWAPRDVPPAFQPMLEEWHRRAHGGAAAGSSTGPGAATGPDAATGPTGPAGPAGPTPAA